MQCPKCKNEMKLVNNDITFREDGKPYDRGIYHCEIEDVWVVVEVPQKKNLA